MDESPKEKRRRSKLAIVSGGVLMSLAVFVAVSWFYLLRPMLHLTDPDWLMRHTELARWEERNASWNRIGLEMSSADWSGLSKTLWGDKAMFQRLLSLAPSYSGCRNCAGIDAGLECISNHSFGTDEQWRIWYEANKNKSQEEWIQQGFEDAKLKVAMPPLVVDPTPLLVVIGKEFTTVNSEREGRRQKFTHPLWLRFNAYRWLRDSGFDPVDYMLEHRGIALAEDVAAGLRFYSKYGVWFPDTHGPGRLSFAPHDENPWDIYPELNDQDWIKTREQIAVTIILTFAVGGYFLTRRGLRTLRLKSTPASPTSRPLSIADDLRDR